MGGPFRLGEYGYWIICMKIKKKYWLEFTRIDQS